tara:strand:- start:21288 stop:21533 length:246 start_codon:yes stop_codon:yes gene_type:complete
MSHWNYRAIRSIHEHPNGETEECFALHEVHYDDEGNIKSYSTEPTSFVGEDLSGLIGALNTAILDIRTREVLDEDTMFKKE